MHTDYITKFLKANTTIIYFQVSEGWTFRKIHALILDKESCKIYDIPYITYVLQTNFLCLLLDSKFSSIVKMYSIN
ncbi:MAG TPA: hypothetical protein DEF25_02435 [Thermoanaerobacter sp.]|nr:hypothetical protein [Thermoanaerobacter sp.]